MFTAFQPAYPALKHLGIVGLTVTLYLIGTGLSMQTLREVGVRPLLQGICCGSWSRSDRWR